MRRLSHTSRRDSLADDYVGVFIIDQTLKVLQTFHGMTRSSFRKAIDEAEKT